MSDVPEANDSRIRTIRIKTGVVKRLSKEVLMYEKEAGAQKEKIENMKRNGEDEYDIRKQEEVLQESLMMIPDCQKRLYLAHEELKGLLESETDLVGTEECKSAQLVLSETKASLIKQ